MATVIAIETSCDETAAAVVKKRHILSSVVSSQIAAHQAYGGVVPEVASRLHVEMINAVVAEAIAQSGLGWDQIDGIGVTAAPGLVGALLVGLSAAKTLAMLQRKPLIGIHHLEGHIYASYLVDRQLRPPFLCLLVSGGHTSLIRVENCGQYLTLGQTRDDAVGEAFDKVARLLGLGYPGGPAIDRAARAGDPGAFDFPEGNISLPAGGFHPYDSSFSGLKTAALRLVERLRAQEGDLPVADLAASFQASVARSLTKRALRCAQDHQLSTLVVGGGVAANSALRSHLTAAAQAQGVTVIFPPLSLCTDNAAMIACAAAEHLERGHQSSLSLGAQSRFGLEQVMALYDSSTF
ncbi:tRNA (adenosine(37)-N6)-threonylcarbamoyltransferase complex transferase subunit TsaD [Lyngbya confervoides]|uniref:tRNA N6-adenosine threonylcarbamoyltransferase n=1 Tax=Lyngbya confervoides BDU141951 TaxID=1574623 RepID=A0ABD4T1H7_9CYAN|nr:tRNA (adenosine(37)-N6)-threonylcarbamoyltransferase complex transferase subunit TsaD [Lyngbya confervoides]MCM1982210.1 tRNA (adenosine(37)-N6)-threonylcarbamoyltransferase complex transferase subunit TsaD [Lyngbya confervoides BDU141951]